MRPRAERSSQAAEVRKASYPEGMFISIISERRAISLQCLRSEAERRCVAGTWRTGRAETEVPAEADSLWGRPSFFVACRVRARCADDKQRSSAPRRAPELYSYFAGCQPSVPLPSKSE